MPESMTFLAGAVFSIRTLPFLISFRQNGILPKELHLDNRENVK
jgi:hypothetical protein